MKAINLVGKLAIRTKPVYYSNGNYDRSYTTYPIRIHKVTKNHIVYSHEGTSEENIFGKKVFILDNLYNDNNWADYNKLVRFKSG